MSCLEFREVADWVINRYELYLPHDEYEEYVEELEDELRNQFNKIYNKRIEEICLECIRSDIK
jgi:hypothetical protein